MTVRRVAVAAALVLYPAALVYAVSSWLWKRLLGGTP